MEEKIGFFARSQSSIASNKFNGWMGAIQTEDNFENARNRHILTITLLMESASGQWDECCEISIGWIGDHFISRISDEIEDLTKQQPLS